MAHERIYCHADPTWHTSQPGDESQAPDARPGILVQWHDELGTFGIATGDLAIEDHGEASDELVDRFLTAPVLPTDDHPDGDTFHALGALTELVGPPKDSDTAEAFERIVTAVRSAVGRAYSAGTAVPRMVWMDRSNANQVIRTVRHGRNKTHGADE